MGHPVAAFGFLSLALYGLAVYFATNHALLAATASILMSVLSGALAFLLLWVYRWLPQCTNAEDLELLSDGGDAQFPVQIEIVQSGFITGRDRGVMWQEDDQLIFHGHRSSFVLRPQDIDRFFIHDSKRRQKGSRLSLLRGRLRLLYSERPVDILFAPLEETTPTHGVKGWWENLRRAKFGMSVLFPARNPLHEIFAIANRFSGRPASATFAQLPPLTVDLELTSVGLVLGDLFSLSLAYLIPVLFLLTTENWIVRLYAVSTLTLSSTYYLSHLAGWFLLKRRLRRENAEYLESVVPLADPERPRIESEAVPQPHTDPQAVPLN